VTICLGDSFVTIYISYVSQGGGLTFNHANNSK